MGAKHEQPPTGAEFFSFSMSTEGSADLPVILSEPSPALFSRLAKVHHQAFDRMNEDGWKGSVIEDLYHHEGVAFYVAIIGEDIAGFCIIRSVSDEAELLTLAIDPAMQKKGLANGMMMQALTQQKRLRVAQMFLEVRTDNTAALKVYEKLGFEIMGMRKKYYKTRIGDRLDAYTLRKHLH